MEIFNRILACFLFLSILGALLFHTMKPWDEQKLPILEPNLLQKTVIYLPQEALADFGEGFLGHRSTRCWSQIESQFEFLGATCRPDQEKREFFFTWKGQEYQQNEGSALNFKTLDISGQEDLESLKLIFHSDEGQPVVQILDGDQILLKEALTPKIQKHNLYIESVKFDQNFLVRQKVTWVGQDCFVKNYGSSEFPKGVEGVRLDCNRAQDPYFVFVELGDILAYKDSMWQHAGEDSKRYPLMRVEKIESKYLYLTLWSSDGKIEQKVKLTQAFSKPPSESKPLLKFVGAKTKSKWLVENKESRFSLEQGDWIILKNSSWTKITTLEDLEAYVSRVNKGELFVIKGLIHDEGNKCLVGDFYNLLRTECQEIKMPLQIDKKKK